jgi:hypothetical protein
LRGDCSLHLVALRQAPRQSSVLTLCPATLCSCRRVCTCVAGMEGGARGGGLGWGGVGCVCVLEHACVSVTGGRDHWSAAAETHGTQPAPLRTIPECWGWAVCMAPSVCKSIPADLRFGDMMGPAVTVTVSRFATLSGCPVPALAGAPSEKRMHVWGPTQS